MFVVTLTYTADVSEIDAAMARHMSWVRRQYADGVFVASGRQNPRVGGVILAHGLSREDLEARIAQDPFVAEGLAETTIVEFRTSQTAPGFEALSA